MNIGALSGKKIIFFGPKTFGYEVEIVREMEQLGAEVTFHGQLPSEHPFVKAIFRLFPKLAWKYADRYFRSWIKHHGPPTCDLVFVIKGEGLSPNFLQYLKDYYPNSRFILHLWDSLVNCKYIKEKFQYFDSLSSFDPTDCREMSFFNYRPLFFMDKYIGLNTQKNGKGLFFIGTLNGDRPKVVSRIVSVISEDIFFDYWLFVRSKAELFIRKIINPSMMKLNKKRLLFSPMSHEAIKNHIEKCCAVLDIEHVNQSGLTMRTFEVLASGKKLVTTNSSIAEHEFYDPSRICVINRYSPIFPSEFFISTPSPLPDDFMFKYSLRGWILDIFKSDVFIPVTDVSADAK